MSCTKHFLNLEWPHHRWMREVTATDKLSFQETDMWGGRYDVDQVSCHTRLICQDCGAVRDHAECTCEPDEGERCRARLAHLNAAAAEIEVR